MSDEKLLVLHAYVQSLVESGILPGAAVEVSKNEEIIFSETFGFMDLIKEKKVSRDTLYRIFSNTKPITAVAVLILVDRGQLHLDQHISRWIPNFKDAKVFVSELDGVVKLEELSTPITLRHLMSHTSGITYGIFGDHYCDKILMRMLSSESRESWFRCCSLEALCDAVSRTPLLFQPGQKWNYGLNFEILSRIIEIETGCSFDEFLASEIFIPLGMADTRFYVPDEFRHNVMPSYEVAPGQSFFESSSSKYDVFSTACLKGGGGGLISSLRDLSTFARCLCADTLYGSADADGNRKRLLSDDSVRLISTNVLVNASKESTTVTEIAFNAGFSESIGPGIGFGLGVYVLEHPIISKGGSLSCRGEYGWGGIASTWMMVDPDQGLTLTFMTQLSPSSAYPIRSQLRWLSHFISQ